MIIKADEAITELLGWSAEEMLGHRTIDFIHPDDKALAIDNWMEMLAPAARAAACACATAAATGRGSGSR